MNLCSKILLLLLLSATLTPAQQLRKVDVKLDWHAPAGFETNGIYNIRYLAEGAVTSDWKTWPILSTVTNSVSHLLYNVWETQQFSVTHTNELTGVESAHGISPVYSEAFFRTNDANPFPATSSVPDAKDFPDELKPMPPLFDPNPLPPDIEPEPHAATSYYVDPVAGSDTNSGLSISAPWKTCKTLGPGDTVTFKGGTVYRGNISVNSGASYFGTSAWGGGKAILDGSIVITNQWLQCTNALDAGGNTNWSKIWWTTIPAGVSNCLPTMFSNGTNLCPWSQEPDPSDPIFWEVLSEWRPVPSTNIGTTWLRDSTNLTQADGYYDETFAAVWVSGNSTVVVPITNYVAASNTIWFANSTPPYSDRDNYYALINHPQFIDKAGEWAVRNAENRLYLLPPIAGTNPNTQQLSIARRGSAFTGFANNVTVSGFAARGYYQPPGENGYSGQFVAIGNSDWITHNVTVSSNDLYFFKSFNSGPVIDIQRGSNALVSWNYIHDSLISRGMLINGTRGSAVTNNTISRMNGTGIYFNGGTNGLVAGNRVLDIIGIHGNGISVYGYCTNVTVSANLVSNCTSLLTYEQSADVAFINNIIDANGKDYRISEWGGTWGPVRWYNNTLANNPSGNMMASASGTSPGAAFTNSNNIISGGGRSNQTYNIYTKLAWFQATNYGWKLGSNESVADASLVFVNTNAHDWKLRSNSPAINAGLPLTNLFTTDFSGVVRGPSWDIGAYESGPQPQVTGLSLQLAWQGPTNWQSQGGIFNLRAATNNSIPTNYVTWPVVARVTNTLSTTFYNVSPTQWYAISFTNALLSSESYYGISPVTGQYTQQ